MVGNAGAARVNVGTAEVIRRYGLAGRGFDERGAAEKDRALALHDDRLSDIAGT